MRQIAVLLILSLGCAAAQAQDHPRALLLPAPAGLATVPLTLTSPANPSQSTLTLTGATALTTSQPVLNMAQTWVTAGTTYTGLLLNVTNTASQATSLLMDLQVGGQTKFNVSEVGDVTAGRLTGASYVATGASTGFVWTGLGGFFQPSDGVIEMVNSGVNDFGRLQFGGTTSSFPSLKRSTTSIIVRLADDTADTGLEARSFTSGGATPTPTGTCATPTMAGGNTAGTMTTGTGCGGTTIILTFALTAPTGWACTTTNRTLSTRVMPQTGSSTTTATFTGTTSNSDVLGYSCMAY